MKRLGLIILATAALLLLASSSASRYYLMLGSRITSFDHLPLIAVDGRDYLTLALLDELGLSSPPPTEGQDEDPSGHYSPDDGSEGGVVGEGSQGDATVVNVIAAEPGSVVPSRAGRIRHRLAGHMLDVSLPGAQLAAEIDGEPVGAADLRIFDGGRYIAAAKLGELGLHLTYNALENLYQIVGLIYSVDYQQEKSAIVMRSLTPMSIKGVQGSEGLVTLIAEGGFLLPRESVEFTGDPNVSKLGFKSQPSLGRSFIFIRQPQRTGFKVDTDDKIGYARVRFGKYLQVVSHQKTSSGEIAINVQLGAPCSARHEMLADPYRVVVDFPGAIYEDATQRIPVNIGRAERVRIGTPEPGIVRVVLDLKDRADYRILSKDNGARYYIQLLPPTPEVATPVQRRVGRTIMVDAGHGGSDPGAQGVLSGVWEAPVNLAISQMLTAELRSMGYDVLETRRSDRFVSLGARADYANSALPYVFVSVHANWIEKPDFQGVMTFHYPSSYHGPRLAAAVQEEVIRATGAVDKGVRDANFFVLRETAVPSILVECGFLTNAQECRRLIDPGYQSRIALGIAKGVDRYVTGGR